MAWAPIRRCRGRTRSWCEEIEQTVLQPTVDELRRRGTPFSGLLYAGLAITSRGVRVIEFNARFGDPETQVVLARLRTPLAGLLHAAATGAARRLPAAALERRGGGHRRRRRARLPGTPAHGRRRSRGWTRSRSRTRPRRTCCTRAPSGTRSGRVVSAGGRVLSVTATGAGLAGGARAGVRGGRPHPARRLAPPHGHRGQRRPSGRFGSESRSSERAAATDGARSHARRAMTSATAPSTDPGRPMTSPTEYAPVQSQPRQRTAA